MKDREKLDAQRKKAIQYMLNRFSREQRHLAWYQREITGYLQSADWLMTEEARNYQKFWDFISEFEGLKAHMREFRWSADFLKENGVDFKAARKIYFAVS